MLSESHRLVVQNPVKMPFAPMHRWIIVPLAIIVPIIFIGVAIACCTCCRSKICPSSRVKVGPRRRKDKQAKEIIVDTAGPPTQSVATDNTAAENQAAAPMTTENVSAVAASPVWTRIRDPQTGNDYYLNSITNQTQWDPPADFDPST